MKIISLITLIVLILFSTKLITETDLPTNKIFEGGRFPGLVMTDKGTILSFWGADTLVVRRSEDKGKTFGPIIKISNGINAGGAIFEKKNGTIFAFSQNKHPPSESYVHVSKDDGLTWKGSKIIYENLKTDKNKSKNNNFSIKRKTELHFADNGINLESAVCKGRIIRPSRIYGNFDGFNNAIYSDDLINWSVSENFPINGTGEGALVELDDGVILYSSRRHWFPSEESLSPYRLFAKSNDCGKSWHDPFEADGMYDGPRYRSIKNGKGPTHQNHFGLMGSMTKLKSNSSSILLHSSTFNERASWLRKGLVLYISFDNGITWEMSKTIHKGPAAYSSILISKNHENIFKSDVYILFEGGYDKEYEGGYFINMKLDKLFPSLL